ncbi:MAG TPA: threonine aldolase, partial [Flavilitoribacter sp.]|nr:threonine aldolase [Flavilitoribacter sp.]
TLRKMSCVTDVRPVQSNIVIFDVAASLTAASFLEKLAAHGILATPFGPQTVRFVTHLDFTEEMLSETIKVLEQLDN